MMDAAAATYASAMRGYYTAMADWLIRVVDRDASAPRALLDTHRRWLLAELAREPQTWREFVPAAVEASARWSAEGVQASRFILGATVGALAAPPHDQLVRLAASLRWPQAVRDWLATLEQAGERPGSVQVGLAASARVDSVPDLGWTRRVYLEGGSLAVPMRAVEWRGRDVRTRSYMPWSAEDLRPLASVPAAVASAWMRLLGAADAAGPEHPALLRLDEGPGRPPRTPAVALHVQLRDASPQRLRAQLLHVAHALQAPLDAVDSWLQRLPPGTRVSVVSLGRANGLHLTVYVAPDQYALPQPGPSPQDLRRSPGSICRPLLRGGVPAGWLLFALPGARLERRPAALNPCVQVWVDSGVSDGHALAQEAAACVTSRFGPLAARLDAAEPSLVHLLRGRGLTLAPANVTAQTVTIQ